MKIPTAVLGATGYAGEELARILTRHPHASVAALYNSTDFSFNEFGFSDSTAPRNSSTTVSVCASPTCE